MWELAITTTFEAGDAVAELVGRIFGGGVAVYSDFESGTTRVTLYRRVRSANFSARRVELRRGLARIKQCGLDVGPGRLAIRRLARRNWAEVWKRHFKPLEIEDALLIKPSWSRRRPRKGQGLVVLDPGLSFGTGHHPTTMFCLRQLVSRRRARPWRQAFLDLGTGSGILAIAAAKLGYAPVHALDVDAQSVRVARANVRANRLAGQVRIRRQNLTQLPLQPVRRYDVICANLLATLLLTEAKRIINRLKPGGLLVVAGILRSEFHRVVREYQRLGLRRVADRSEGEWRSGAFTR
jgi:ribosomal protein L11 methyltransferase